MILHVRAPFAVFRPFQAGAYRSTLPVMPPSTAYGLALNLAGIDARDPASLPPTRYRADAPALEIAVGICATATVSSLYQQLHAYRVGTDAATKALAARTHGAKYWIAPARREVLVGYEGLVAVRSDDGAVEERIAQALAGSPIHPRYGLPFAGDNNFLFDKIERANGVVATWYSRCDDAQASVRGTVRLPIRIDRADQSRTEIGLYAPSAAPVADPPEEAWTSVRP